MSRDMSGSMKRNARKEKSSHPDYKGKVTIAGKDYWLSGWKKEGDDGTWVSLAFEEKKDKAETVPAGRTAPRRGDDW